MTSRLIHFTPKIATRDILHRDVEMFNPGMPGIHIYKYIYTYALVQLSEPSQYNLLLSLPFSLSSFSFLSFFLPLSPRSPTRTRPVT